jgi:hypothetical protein
VVVVIIPAPTAPAGCDDWGGVSATTTQPRYTVATVGLRHQTRRLPAKTANGAHSSDGDASSTPGMRASTMAYAGTLVVVRSDGLLAMERDTCLPEIQH